MPQTNIISKKKTTERNYKLKGKNVLSNVGNEKNLGVIIESSLLIQEHIAKETKLANSVVTGGNHGEFLQNKTYINQSWNPFLIKEKVAIENIHRKATRLTSRLCK